MNETGSRNPLQRQLQRLHETPRLILVAVTGSLIGLLIYELIYYVNPFEPRASTSWFLSYLVGVVRQHALHRWLTFADDGPYWQSLGRAYVLYTSLLVLTTLLNYVLVEYLQLNHHVVWLICISVVGAINLFALKRFVYPGRQSDA